MNVSACFLLQTATSSVLFSNRKRSSPYRGQTSEPTGRTKNCRCFAVPEAGQRNISKVLFNKQRSVCTQQMSLFTTFLGQVVLLAAAFNFIFKMLM
jgi:hypothetical protein